MEKYKSIPNQGTRKIGLPAIGDVEFKNGEVELDDEQFTKLKSKKFGFMLKPVNGKIVEDGGEVEDEDNEAGDETFSIESLSKLRVKDLDEIAEALELSEEEMKEYEALQKAERVKYLHEKSK